MATLLITNLQLKSGTPMGGNVDVDKYRMKIEEVQNFEIEPILGTKLYKKILTDFEGGPLTGIYKTIHEDYLIAIIKYLVLAEYVMVANINVGNAGIFTRNPENSTPVPSGELVRLSNKYSANADVYTERLIRFLKDSLNEIPEYRGSQDENYDVKPRNDVDTYSNWFLEEDTYKHRDLDEEIMRDIRNDLGRG